MPVSSRSGPSTSNVFWLRVLFSIKGVVVVAGAIVGLVHEFDRMTNAQLHSRNTSAGADVHLAAWIAGGEYVRVRLADVVQFLMQDALRHLRLNQVVDAGGAATAFAAV